MISSAPSHHSQDLYPYSIPSQRQRVAAKKRSALSQTIISGSIGEQGAPVVICVSDSICRICKFCRTNNFILKQSIISSKWIYRVGMRKRARISKLYATRWRSSQTKMNLSCLLLPRRYIISRYQHTGESRWRLYSRGEKIREGSRVALRMEILLEKILFNTPGYNAVIISRPYTLYSYETFDSCARFSSLFLYMYIAMEILVSHTFYICFRPT